MNTRVIKLKYFILFFVLLISINYVFAQVNDSEKYQIGESETEVNVGAKDKALAKNVEIDPVNGNLKITLNEGGLVKVNLADRTEIYSDFGNINVNLNGKIQSIKPSLTFNNNGQIIKAYFTTNKDNKIILGNYELNLKAGDGVTLQNGKLTIIPKDGKITELPKKLYDNPDGNLEISFFSPRKDNKLILGNDEEFSNGILKFEFDKDNNGYFFVEGGATYAGLEIINKNNVKTILSTTGERVLTPDVAYISTNIKDGKLVIGTNNGEGPIVKFINDKKNSYGIWVQPTDHLSVKAYEKGSFISITNRNKDGLIPDGNIVGTVAINEDNKGIFVKDYEVVMTTNGKYFKMSGEVTSESPMELEEKALTFSSQSGKDSTTVPIQFNFAQLDENGDVRILSDKKMIVTNSLEFSYGKKPTAYRGESYDKLNPVFSRTISDKLTYNYPNEKNFEKLTGLKLSMDDYSRKKMTTDQYRMLMDMYFTLTPENVKAVKEVMIHKYATMGGYPAAAWGGPGAVEYGMNYIKPNILLHEPVHSITLLNSKFEKEWLSVGGGSINEGGKAYVSDYAKTTWKEHAAEYGAWFIYREPTLTSKKLNDLEDGPYYRAQLSVLTKHKVVTMDNYNSIMKSAGLETGNDAVEKYIKEGKTKFSQIKSGDKNSDTLKVNSDWMSDSVSVPSNGGINWK